MKTSVTKLLLLIGVWGMFTAAHAIVIPLPSASQGLNQVSFEVAAEQWITTKTAKILITVNASLDNHKLASAYPDITQKLQKLMGDAQWHVIGFERNTDKTGLEQLTLTAEARLNESALATLKERLKNSSKPGEAYTIASIDYTSTLAEREVARSMLRAQIYNQIKTELTQLNTAYPNQKYTVHQINFMEGDISPMPSPLMLMAADNAMSKQAAPVVGVSNNLQIRARVILASVPAINPAN